MWSTSLIWRKGTANFPDVPLICWTLFQYLVLIRIYFDWHCRFFNVSLLIFVVVDCKFCPNNF